jgi:hypothetical protein
MSQNQNTRAATTVLHLLPIRENDVLMSLLGDEFFPNPTGGGY